MKIRAVAFIPILLAVGLCVPAARGEGRVTQAGSVLTIDVTPETEFTYDEPIGENVTRLVKTGTGTLIINVDNAAFKGEVAITEGIVKITHCYALGQSTAETRLTDGAIIVSDKAQLYSHLVRRGQAFEQISKRLVLSGNGPDGLDNTSKGAFVARPNGTAAGGTYAQDAWIAHVELAADATVHIVDSPMGIKTTDLRGHTLTIGNYYDGGYVDCAFAGSRHLSAGTIYNWGTATAYDGGFGLQFRDTMTWPEEGRVSIVSDASMLKLSNLAADESFAADLRLCNTANDNVVRLYAYAVASSDYHLTGNLDISSKTILSTKAATDPQMTVRLTGLLQGGGDLEVSGANMHFIAENPQSDYSGNLTVTDAKMTACGLASAGSITLAGAAELILPIGENGWDGWDLFGLLANVSMSGQAKAVVYTGAGDTASTDAAFSGTTLRHGGAGTLTLTGALNPDGSSLLVNEEGTLALSGETERWIKSLQVEHGTLLFDDAGIVHMGAFEDDSIPSTKWQVGGTGVAAAAPARMIVKGNSTLVANVPPSGTQQKGGLRVEETAAQGAILEIHAGATVTNTIHVGENTNTRGAVYQYGGDVYNSAVNGNDAYCGCEHGSYGYYGLYDGSFFFRALFACNYYADSTGIIEQRGGRFETENKAYVGRGGGWGEFHMTGGTAIFPNGLTVGGGLSTAGEQAVMTLAGAGNPDAQADYGPVTLNNGTGALLAALNLNAGQLSTRRIERGIAKADAAAGNHAFVNFNGGKVVLKSSDNVSFFGTGAKAVDRITVFAGGMTFDTNGYNCPQDQATPFLRPTGRGVASIALPANMENGTYIGPPEVKIVGGNGEGATAHAVFDPATLSVTGIEVTCPGWDYTEPPTVTIATADRASVVTCTATLTEGDEQVGGAFVKAGSGMLTLSAANTYAGPTVLRGGTLVCGANGAIPQNTTVVIEGGVLDMQGRTMADGSPAPLKWGVDYRAVQAAGRPMEYPVALAFPEGATLDVLNFDSPADDVESVDVLTIKGARTGTPEVGGFDADRWRAKWVGNTLRLSRTRALSIILR